MSQPKLKTIDTFSVELLTVSAQNLHQLFPEPTILHLPGRQVRPLFVSVLLHGNETSGLAVVQTLIKRQAGAAWPRALSVFFGNVEAARAGLRRLDGQPDFNRIWPGTELDACAETALARALCEDMAGRGVFASIDVHNNTGRNPPYACVERLDAATLGLAGLFDPLAIYSPHPKGTQTGAFAGLCPSLTLECGQPGEALGLDKAVACIEACLRLPEIPCQPVPGQNLFHALAQVMVHDDISFSYADAQADLWLRGGLDALNFCELPAGTVFGRMPRHRPGDPLPLIARTDTGEDVAAEFFQVAGQDLLLSQAAMPCMLSLDERVIRQDCLCYLMRRM